MRNEYLDYQGGSEENTSLFGILGSVYAYSSVEMLAELPRTGRYSLPWTGLFNKGKGIGIRVGGLEEKFVPRPMDYWHFKTYKPLFTPTNFRGAAHLSASKAASFALGALTWNDPLWFAIQYWNNPMIWPAGVAWFTLSAAAKGMERSMYVNMSPGFTDTENSVTSRQRAVRAISESHLQARSAIGNEAQLFHR
jgi:hypothetical protein